MEPIVTKKGGHVWIENDRAAFHPDRGGKTDEEYEIIIAELKEELAEKESTIEALEEALAAVKYFVNKTITNGTVVFKDASGTDITTALTTLTTGVAKDTVVTGTITPSEGYRVTGVTVNGTAVTVTENAFTFTLDGNKAIVITLDIIQP